MNTKNESTLRGFNNVLIEGDKLGSIVWDETTGLIVWMNLREQSSLFSDQDGVAWMDGKGLEVYPAGIDLHVHDRSGQPDKEDPEHLTRACVEGGVGTIFTMPNGNPSFTRLNQLGELMARWQDSPLTVYYHIGASRDNLEEIAGLSSVPSGNFLGGVKIFYASSTGSLLIDDEPSQRRAAGAVYRAGKIQVIHAECEELIKSNRREIENESQPCLTDHYVIRNSEVEVQGIRRALEICEDTGVRTHICHVSTERGLELIAKAKAAGLPITCETCPHYWRLNASCLFTMGGLAKMNPALRSEDERQRVEVCLCQEEVIDVVASDHAPHELELKGLKDYDKCPSGVPGVQTLVLMAYDLKASGKITAKRFVNLTSRNAARIFDLNKGELAAGKDADLVLINPDGYTVFTNSSMESKCGWTPFHGQSVAGSIAAVVFGGKVIKGVTS